MLRVGCRKRLMARSCGVVVALTLVPGVASAQTLTDPVGDNCRNYPGLPGSPDITGCGPDISQAVFTSPGDGNLHVNVSYASLPSGPLIPQLPTYIELGIYPKTATTPQLVVGSHRFSNFGGTWKLQLLSSTAFQVLADGSATTSALGIELVVPLGPLGDPSNYLYALNSGSNGEVIPEHPDLAPNTGLFSLAAAPGGGGGGGGTTLLTPEIEKLTGIPKRQTGTKIAGRVNITTPGSLTVDALVPQSAVKASAAAKKLTSIGKVTKKNQPAGTVRFSLRLKKAAKRKLAGKRVKVTLRLTLKPTGQSAVTATRKVTLKVPG